MKSKGRELRAYLLLLSLENRNGFGEEDCGKSSRDSACGLLSKKCYDTPTDNCGSWSFTNLWWATAYERQREEDPPFGPNRKPCLDQPGVPHGREIFFFFFKGKIGLYDWIYPAHVASPDWSKRRSSSTSVILWGPLWYGMTHSEDHPPFIFFNPVNLMGGEIYDVPTIWTAEMCAEN